MILSEIGCPLFRIMLQAPSCAARKGNPQVSVHFRCGGKRALQCLDVGTCGRIAGDSCARVTPYCSVWAVGYDISCGGSDPKSPSVQRSRSGTAFAPGEG